MSIMGIYNAVNKYGLLVVPCDSSGIPVLAPQPLNGWTWTRVNDRVYVLDAPDISWGPSVSAVIDEVRVHLNDPAQTLVSIHSFGGSSVMAGTFTVNWNASGILRLTFPDEIIHQEAFQEWADRRAAILKDLRERKYGETRNDMGRKASDARKSRRWLFLRPLRKV